MFGEIPDHIRKRHARGAPVLGSLDDIMLPMAPMAYEIIAPEPEARSAVLDSSALLDNITQEALKRLHEKVSDHWSGDPS